MALSVGSPTEAVREASMIPAEDVMGPAQMAALLDAALRVADPLSYLDTTAMTFRALGRGKDARATAWMGCLYAEGEIELLMSLRATWRMGRVRSPESIVG